MKFAFRLVVGIGIVFGLLSCGGGAGGTGASAQVNAERLPPEIKTVPFVSTATALIDVDGDGDLDLYLGPMFRQTRDVLLINNGKGQYSMAPASSLPDRYGGSGFGAPSAYVADFNNDGKQDLLISLTSLDYSQGYLQLFLNNGKGGFVDASDRIPQELSRRWVHDIRVADFDGDGLVDFVAAGTFSTSSDLYRNTGNATFSKINLFPFGTSISLGDVNGDGKKDLVSIDSSWKMRVLFNTSSAGRINFTETSVQLTQPVTPAVVQTSILADIDNDGDLDLLLTLYGDGGKSLTEPRTPIMAFKSDGKGVFTDTTASVFPSNPTSVLAQYIFVRDLNNDGRVDIFIADNGPHYNAQGVGMPGKQSILLIQNGSGQFEDKSGTNLPSNFSGAPHAATFGDIDGDGDFDIFLANINLAIQPATFFVNDGTAKFSSQP